MCHRTTTDDGDDTSTECQMKTNREPFLSFVLFYALLIRGHFEWKEKKRFFHFKAPTHDLKVVMNLNFSLNSPNREFDSFSCKCGDLNDNKIKCNEVERKLESRTKK